jgi:predicted nucleic acid-binding protein
MGVIWDSCIWVALAAGQLTKQALITATGDATVMTSVVSLGELSFGVHACADPAERARRAAFFRQIESSPMLGISKHTAEAFGLLCASLKQAGRSPRPRYNDLWIAAQAIENDCVLLTLNGKDFADMPGLQLKVLNASGE